MKSSKDRNTSRPLAGLTPTLKRCKVLRRPKASDFVTSTAAANPVREPLPQRVGKRCCKVSRWLFVNSLNIVIGLCFFVAFSPLRLPSSVTMAAILFLFLLFLGVLLSASLVSCLRLVFVFVFVFISSQTKKKKILIMTLRFGR